MLESSIVVMKLPVFKYTVEISDTLKELFMADLLEDSEKLKTFEQVSITPYLY